MRPYIFFEGGGRSDARWSDWAAPWLPPASHCSVLFFRHREGHRSSTKETRLLTRTFCLCLHARFWVPQGTERACKKGNTRKVPWSSAAAQYYVAGLCWATPRERQLSRSLFSSTQQQRLSDQASVIWVQQFSLPFHLLLSKSFFNSWAGSTG